MEEGNRVKLDADKIYRAIGPTGRFQMLLFALHGLLYCSHAWHFLGFIFMVDTPPYRCAVPPGETINTSIPEGDTCNVYTNLSINNKTQPCSHGYWFDRDYGYESTIVTDFDLYCDKNILVEICITVSAAALALSQLVSSKFTDMYGRKKMVVIGLLGRGIAGFIKAFSPNMATYMVFDAVRSIFFAMYLSSGIVMIVELFPPECRLRYVTLAEFFWLTSYASTCVLVYILRNWRHLQLAFSVPLLLSIALIWILPESLPWLCLNGRNKEAMKVARKAARINGVTLPDEILLTEDSETKQLTKNEEKLEEKPEAKRDSEEDKASSEDEPVVWKRLDPSMIHVFTKSRKLRRYTFINFIVWFTNNLVYTSLSLTVTMLAGDGYLNFFYYWLAEIPAIIIFCIAVNKWGRRVPLCVFHIIAGLGCVGTVLEAIDVGMDTTVPVLILNLIGKAGITASYCVIISYVPEMYPTNLRSKAVGICWGWAILGELIAPYSRVLERAVPGLVRVLCGILSILVGILVLWLPETFGRKLPETIGDVEKWTLTVNNMKKNKPITMKIDTVQEKM